MFFSCRELLLDFNRQLHLCVRRNCVNGNISLHISWKTGKLDIIQMYLREMEDTICFCVSARDHVEPQLPHEEHSIVDQPTCGTHTYEHRGLYRYIADHLKSRRHSNQKMIYYHQSFSHSWTSQWFASDCQRSSLSHSNWETETE